MFGYKQNKVDTAKPSAEGFCTWPPSYHCLGQLEIGMKQPHTQTIVWNPQWC